MIAPSEVERARSRLVEIVGAEVALKPAGREFKGLCPYHVEKSPSFFVVPHNGFYHCFGCGAHGTAIDFVMRTRRLDFVDAVRHILNLPEQAKRVTREVPRVARADNDDRTIERVQAIIASCEPVHERSAAWLYLWSRGLKTHQPALLAHPALYCHEVGRPLPALVAPILDGEDGHLVAVQRIWVNDRLESVAGIGPQDARAALQTRKKGLGTQCGGAVRLAPAGPVLGLAEGAESAIASSMLLRIPVWSTCGAARLGRVYLPDVVGRVVICGDNGSTGHALAEAAVELLAERGFPAAAVFPDPEYGDFADQIIRKRVAA